MDLLLEGKTAVVTGAGKGIGFAVTKALAQEGAEVVAGSLDTNTLAGLAGVTPVAVDLTDPAGPARLVQHAVDDRGAVDILVNNVGATRVRLDGFLAVTDEDFDWAMRMNFYTTLRATRAALPSMVARGSGAIVNIASVNAFYQPDGATVDYGAAKAGVDADTARKQIVAGMGGIPTGRFTTAEEVATLVVMLASERAANVTGANFVIDGGLIKTT